MGEFMDNQIKNESQTCACQQGVKLIFTCSGSADVGEISDRSARKLSTGGVGKMVCLAGIGGNVSGIIASAKGAEKMLVLDGCHLDCGRKTMEEKGITNFLHLRVTDLGMPKSKSPVTEERIATVTAKGKEMLMC